MRTRVRADMRCRHTRMGEVSKEPAPHALSASYAIIVLIGGLLAGRGGPGDGPPGITATRDRVTEIAALLLVNCRVSLSEHDTGPTGRRPGGPWRVAVPLGNDPGVRTWPISIERLVRSLGGGYRPEAHV